MMTTPVGGTGSGGSTPPVGGTAPLTSPLDTIASSPYVIEGGLSIQEFARIVVQTTNEFLQTAFESAIQDQTITSDFYRALASSAALLADSIRQGSQHSSDSAEFFETLGNTIINQNVEIESFNSGVTSTNPADVTEESEVATLNQAIDDYNNGLITAVDLQAAVDQYESYRAGRNAEVDAYNLTVNNYNLALLDLNITIASLNQEREELNAEYGLNLPLIPSQTMIAERDPLAAGPVAPYTIPVPTLDAPLTITPLTEIPEPPPTDMINADIEALNLLIETYNGGVPTEITEVQDLNAAIAAYNNGTISSAELQDAIDAYNAYKTTRDSEIETLNVSLNDFIAAIPAYNITIDQINVERESFGLLPINYLPEEARFPTEAEIEAGATVPDLITPRDLLPEAPTSPFSIPLDSLTVPGTYPAVGLIGVTDIGILLGEVLIVPIFDSYLPFITDLRNALFNSENYLEFLQFFLPGNIIGLPLSVEERSYNMIPENSTPRGGYGTLSMGLSSPFVESVLSYALFNSIPSDIDLIDVSSTVPQVNLFVFQLLQQVGLTSVLPILSNLAIDLPINGTMPFRGVDGSFLFTVLAFAYGDEIRNLITSGIIAEGIGAIISRNPALASASEQSRLALIEQFSAAVSFNLLLTTLLQMAIALKAPGIVSQVLGLLPSVQGLPEDLKRELNGALAPVSFGELLANPFVESAVVNIIVNAILQESGLSVTGGTGRVRVTGLIASVREAVSLAVAASGGDPAAFLASLSEKLPAVVAGPLARLEGFSQILQLLDSPAVTARVTTALNPLLGPLPETEQGRQRLIDAVLGDLVSSGVPASIIDRIKGILVPLFVTGSPTISGAFTSVEFYRGLGIAAILFIYDQIPIPGLSQQELNQPLLSRSISAEELLKALSTVDLEGVDAQAIVNDVLADLQLKSQITSSLILNDQILAGLVHALLTGNAVLRDLIIRDAITNQAVTRSLSLQDLRHAFIQRLQQELDLTKATVIADAVIQDLRDSQRVQLALVDRAVLMDSIIQSFTQRGILRSEAIRRAAVIADILASDAAAFESPAAFQAGVANIIVDQFGQTSEAAASIASSIVLQQIARTPRPSFTFNEILVSLDEYERSYELDRFDFGVRGRVFSDQNSYYRLMDEQVARLIDEDDKDAAVNLAGLFRSFASPNIDLYTFVTRLLDPGYAVVNAVWGGLQYSSPTHDPRDTSHVKDIDIQV